MGSLLLFSCVIMHVASDKDFCSQILSSHFEIDNYQREYSFYYPSILCDESELSSFIQVHTNYDYNQQSDAPSINLPILLIIHGFNDNPPRFLSHWKWQEYAEKYGMIILAPKGGVNNAKETSWNAQSCCGENLEQNIDDVSFIRELIYKFITDITTDFTFLNINLHNLILFITGHSNGSFMMDKLAWIYANTNPKYLNQDKNDHELIHFGFPIKITAVNPMSAFIYDNTEFLQQFERDYPDSMNGHNKVSIFYQHGTKDTSVDHIGCGCPGAKCCCGITEHSLVCVSINDAYDRWLAWNSGADAVMDNSEYDFGKDDRLDCTWNDDENGMYLTWMCLWKDADHGLWRNEHVDTQLMKDKTIDFFLHVECHQNDGKWDKNKGVCDCGEGAFDDTKKIWYCLKDLNHVEIKGSDEDLNSNVRGQDNMIPVVFENEDPLIVNAEQTMNEQDHEIDVENDVEYLGEAHHTISIYTPLAIVTLVAGLLALCVAVFGAKNKQNPY